MSFEPDPTLGDATVPRVSVGIPVHNGSNFLGEAMTSVLTQTFTDLEVIVSDNASTDDTQAICEAFALKDSRVRYVRQDSNLGAAPNYNYVFALSRGEYFAWLAHDDAYEPTFIERCVGILDRDPEVALVFARARVVDESSRELMVSGLPPGVTSERAPTRFASVIREHQPDAIVFGLMRRAVLAHTRLHASYTGSDRSLAGHLALLGKLVEIRDPLFRNRDHERRSIRRVSKTAPRWRHPREVWFDTSRAGRVVFPNWRRLGDYLHSALTSPIPLSERAACLASIATLFTQRRARFLKTLVLDVADAGRLIVWRMTKARRHEVRTEPTQEQVPTDE